MSNEAHTLYVVEDYRNGKEFYKEGHVLESLSQDKRDWYLRDAPGCFSESKPKVKGKPGKAQDKAVKSK